MQSRTFPCPDRGEPGPRGEPHSAPRVCLRAFRGLDGGELGPRAWVGARGDGFEGDSRPGWQQTLPAGPVPPPPGVSRGASRGLWLQMVTKEASLVTRCNPFFERRAGRGLRS